MPFCAWMAQQANFVISNCRNCKNAESQRRANLPNVFLSEDGIFKHADKGTFILDSSTISPIGAKEFNKQSLEKEMVYIDCPMSGGTKGANAATLTFMVGA